MNAELQSRLSKLRDSLIGGRLDRAALFWLKTFVDLALEDGGEVRSDHWVEAGLSASSQIPGLDAAALAPRRDLVADYDLFRLVRLKDGGRVNTALACCPPLFSTWRAGCARSGGCRLSSPPNTWTCR